ncbi:MAG TPA: hypothetical protein VFI23_10130 [Rhizomicrobium sp.]|nr:hypothetical protein [Rhizomicrobium sp.]
MSHTETDLVLSQDNLPPEIERRLQVEELWARRLVLAELMNAERLRTYAARRALLWPTRFPAMDMMGKDRVVKAGATVVQIKQRKAFAPGA